MPDTNDMDLVREFARDHSEAAFTELVRRHLNLVYSVALRCTRKDGDAQDVTQAVFIILARKAAGLREKTLLTGWLYETTRHAAASLLRANGRRHIREQEAYMQQSTLTEADPADTWAQLSPHLEDAMAKLGERDRALLVLRFYENKSGPEAAALLGIREDTAHKRVTRALEKLRKFFAQRGVTLSGAAIAGAVSANSVQAAPVALAKSVTAVAIVKGSIAAASTLTLVKGALNLMAWTKLKTTIVVGAGVLLAAGTTAAVIDGYLSDWGLVNFKTAPPLVVIQPTHFPQPANLIQDGMSYINANDDGETGKMAGRHVWLKYMIEDAYDFPEDRLVIPSDSKIVSVLTNYYDFLVTTTNHPREKFQAEIKRKFGLVGRREAVKMDVLLLKVQSPDAPGLKLVDPDDPRTGNQAGAGYFYGRKQTLGNLAGFLKYRFKIRVIDQTDLTNRFDIDFKWNETNDQHPNLESLNHALLNQLGLELVPTNMPIEMLVVEKVK